MSKISQYLRYSIKFKHIVNIVLINFKNFIKNVSNIISSNSIESYNHYGKKT